MSEPHSAKRVAGKNRRPVSLNHGLDRKLAGYTLAASAAGVGLLALALPSKAEIVYRRANQTIPRGGGISLDLDHNGIADFNIGSYVSYSCAGPNCVFQNLGVGGIGENRVLMSYGGNGFAQAMPILGRVGPAARFNTFATMDRCRATHSTSSGSQYSTGPWAGGPRTAYLGLAFSINGQTHYGWARLRVSVGSGCVASAVLTGYAYETIAGEPIRAGEMVNHTISESAQPQATLGGLALGSVMLEAWRRDDDAGGNPSVSALGPRMIPAT
jgi:hypothetical protein